MSNKNIILKKNTARGKKTKHHDRAGRKKKGHQGIIIIEIIK